MNSTKRGSQTAPTGTSSSPMASATQRRRQRGLARAMPSPAQEAVSRVTMTAATATMSELSVSLPSGKISKMRR